MHVRKDESWKLNLDILPRIFVRGQRWTRFERSFTTEDNVRVVFIKKVGLMVSMSCKQGREGSAEAPGIGECPPVEALISGRERGSVALASVARDN